MYRLKAFGAFPAFYNNSANVINVIGELSTYGETYASDVPTLQRTDAPNSLLRSFLSVNEVSATVTEPVLPNTAVVAQVLQVMEYLYAHSVSGAIVDDGPSVVLGLLNQFAGKIQTVEVGDMVKDDHNWLPSWVSFEGTSTDAPYAVRIWFSDHYFRNQFDGYEVRPYAPIDDIDGFFNSYSAVQLIAKSITVRDMMARGVVVANNQPATEIDAEEFEWVDPGDKTQKVLIPWGFVTYSEAGLNLDAKKQELIKWILDHSKHTEDEWAAIFPDIFGATEYIFIPIWPHYAIPEDQINGGVWSPVNNPNFVIEAAQALTKGVDYTPDYIKTNLNVMGSSYKCIQIAVVGGPRNRDDIHQFGNRWTDYLSVGSGSIDFRRMSDNTQKMVLILNQLLMLAETMTATSDIPHGFLRTVRNDVMYVSASTERTQLIMASRQSVEELYPPHIGIYKPAED